MGMDALLEDFKEIVTYFDDKDMYTKFRAVIPKGILLSGPPGTGKTYIAKALANECGCNFFYKSGSELEDMFVGETSKKIKKLFKEAKKAAPAIIFIDEIDSIAGKRHRFHQHSEGKQS